MKPLLFAMLLCLSVPTIFGQNTLVGVQVGMGTDGTEDETALHHRYDLTQALLGLYLQDDALLVFRVGKLEHAGPLKAFQPDFSTWALTVDYLFEENIYTAGIYLGPAWFDGTSRWTYPFKDWIEYEESFLGAVAGIEGFFNLSRRLRFLVDLHGWYLPTEKDKRILLGVSAGLTFHF